MNNEKTIQYYEYIREDVLSLIPLDVGYVLDIGCGAGALGRALKEKGIKKVVGIELNEKIANIASKYIDYVIIGDVERLGIPLEDEYFDCIIYADILEHLKDPWLLLKRYKKILKSSGIIVVSLPNIRHYTTLLNLLKGDWPYSNRGIIDKTHLRFFTKKTAKNMLISTGYKIIKIKTNYRLFENPNYKWKVGINMLFSKFIQYFPIIREFFAFQYLIVGKNQ